MDQEKEPTEKPPIEVEAEEVPQPFTPDIIAVVMPVPGKPLLEE